MTPEQRDATPLRRLALVAGAVLAADQVSKAAVVGSIDRGERVELLPFLHLERVSNEGIAFGLLQGAERWLVVAVTGAALLLLVAWYARHPRRPWAWLAIGVLVGGALGNLADRLLRDGVVDFIDLPAWPSFNIADIAITLGAVGLVLTALGGTESEQSAPPDEGRADGG